MKKIKCSLALSVALAISPSINAQDAIPVVPASVMKKASAEAKKLSVESESRANPESGYRGANVSQDAVVKMTPGVNQIIPVAIGHPNRIVTPFGNPEVVSTSLTGGSDDGECGEVCIKDNVVYVATKKNHPVTMFVTEKGSESQALSLTMVPREIPPREVFLKLDGSSVVAGAQSNPKAERWERSKPYIETIRTIFRKLALGDVPQGYSMNKTPNNITPPYCDHPGMAVSFKNGQVLMGHSLTVFVGVAENNSSNALEFNEATCGDWDVAAVTTWPLKVLEPGQQTEVYVARKNAKGKAPTSKRPSLLRGK
ncbi:type-F conjugative transfer system secretin TraK [uncultured Paraglaciecola sp.]|uniref:TraK domain-containing protein n=1 Tax=uncultured Paraglaciecola sp. TaxID=1765024 RepID=UPI00261524D0|nr:type-F conjugative transfer system secretin TraK [uncultured Paraglaciecola sp.]